MTSERANQINPWTHIWVKSRETMRSILERDQKRWILFLAIFNGLMGSINWMVAMYELETKFAPYLTIPVIVIILILGAIFGIIHLYLGGWLLQVCGKWVKGQGHFSEVKCAVGWSCYPMIVASCFNILSNLFATGPYILTLIFALLSIIFTIYAFIIALKLIGEAHRFSAWRSLLDYIIVFAIIFIVMMLILMVIPLLQPLFKA